MCTLQYNLFATDGFIRLPTNAEPCPNTTYTDDVYVWGFVGGLYSQDGTVINPQFADTPENRALLIGTATIPSPRIDCEQGDHVYILLVNLGMTVPDVPQDPHTVHLHGLHVATQVDGFPELSFGVPMGEAVVYYFPAENPGTYMYHCHQEASQHIQMGMYGALVIYPSRDSLAEAGVEIPPGATNRNFAYNHASTYYDKDYVMLLSDLDSTWHKAVHDNDPTFNPVDYKPDWWLVNGRAFPDTLKSHPMPGYESYVHVVSGQTFLLRMINMGYQVVPWHIHGWHFHVTGKDAMRLEYHLMGFTQTIGSGETWDLLLEATSKKKTFDPYIFDGQGGYPALMTQVPPAWWVNVPMEGFACPLDPLLWNYSEHPSRFFPQFYPMHNHDDYKVTNNGVYPGGQLCFIQTDSRHPRP